MHLQPLFADTDPASLRAPMRAYPLATLVITTPHGPDAHLLPLH
jgi:transcriptional regulator